MAITSCQILPSMQQVISDKLTAQPAAIRPGGGKEKVTLFRQTSANF